MRGNRCEVYINDVKSKLFPLGSSGCRSNLPAALFGMKVSINEAGKEKENITKQRDSKKRTEDCILAKLLFPTKSAQDVDRITFWQSCGRNCGWLFL